jgi:DNA topoisomerase-1
MAKYLVIVESPGKIKKISSYLGPNYKVMASIGHIRLLERTGKYNLGIDVDGDFTPSYKNDPKKKDVIKDLKEEAKKAEIIYLASDADLEGESIAWHLQEILKVPKPKLKRITFTEITKKAILDAIQSPRDIDQQKVDAQETRRLLDRIAGFRLSGLALSKLNAKSAGRVQSAALKILVDKEVEIKAFIPETYFEIFLDFAKDKKKYKAKYDKALKTQSEADKVEKECKPGNYIVSDVQQKDRLVKSKPPYTTSTFQQEASSKYGYGAKRAMGIAQSLYEKGLISYMRTDSERLSDDFAKETQEHILSNYGKEYYSGKINFTKKSKDANVQDAHEGIRPTSLATSPESQVSKLESDEYKIYSLIYNRTVASLMTDAKVKDTAVSIANGNHIFKIKGQEVLFEGFYKAYREVNEDEEDEKTLPSFKVGEKISDKGLEVFKKETNPPKRYTEAGLVKVLEKLGIGRPSTYASIMETLTGADYTTKESKTLIPTEKGMHVIEMLKQYFNDSILDPKYTSDLEDKLDKIASGDSIKLNELKAFHSDFEPLVLKAIREYVNPHKIEIATDKICPKCGSSVVIREGKFGQFYACSKYPKCKHTEAIFTEEQKAAYEAKQQSLETAPTCTVCNKGKIVQRVAKKTGAIFYACNNFPKCKTTFNEEEYKEKFN